MDRLIRLKLILGIMLSYRPFLSGSCLVYGRKGTYPCLSLILLERNNENIALKY